MLYPLPAVYVIVLVIFTCILMELHARNYRVIQYLWKPFRKILNKLNMTVVTGDAVVKAFASFIFLSGSNILFTMMALSTRTEVTISPNMRLYKYITLYIDPTVEWFSHKHIQYLLIAAVPFFFLTVIPSLLLCIYPTRIYRYLSQFISARKRLAITAFAEALHNCYKDGLNGTRDYRALAGMVMFLPVLYTLFAAVIRHVADPESIRGSIFMIILCCIISFIRPCKLPLANFSLTYHITVFELLCIFSHLWNFDLNTRTEAQLSLLLQFPTSYCSYGQDIH